MLLAKIKIVIAQGYEKNLQFYDAMANLEEALEML
jgi:hypothetical protein